MMKNTKSQKTKEWRGRSKGFTLVELVIYLAIVSFVLLVVSGFFYNILLGRSKFSARSEIAYNANFAQKKLAFYIQQAQSLQSVSPQTLVLNLPLTQTVTFDFDAARQKLTMQEGSGPVVDLNTDKVAVSGSFSDLSYSRRSRNILVNLKILTKSSNPAPFWQNETDFKLSFELRSK